MIPRLGKACDGSCFQNFETEFRKDSGFRLRAVTHMKHNGLNTMFAAAAHLAQVTLAADERRVAFVPQKSLLER